MIRDLSATTRAALLALSVVGLAFGAAPALASDKPAATVAGDYEIVQATADKV